MKVAVLGGGPSGLLAAWAVVDAGHEPVIFERNPRKPDGSTAGVYYLHDDCNLPLRKREVEIIVSGGATSEERQLAYEQKVYGTCNSTKVSIPRYYTLDAAYDGMQAMDLCWDIVEPFIVEQSVNGWNYEKGSLARSLTIIADQYELVVNTIPLNALLPDREWKRERATIYRNTAPADESYMIYQANLAIPWYRASAIFGVFTLEYPSNVSATELMEKKGPHYEGLFVQVQKVIDSPEAMPEVPENVLLTGRYGAWSKDKLSHHAYLDTMKRLTKGD